MAAEPTAISLQEEVLLSGGDPGCTAQRLGIHFWLPLLFPSPHLGKGLSSPANLF